MSTKAGSVHFEAYSELVESLNGARLLDLQEERFALEQACFGLLDGTADADRRDRTSSAFRARCMAAV